MSSVDERVVSMQFDNRQFESNVKTTMNTLDQLDEKLQFDGAGKGLENLGKIGNNFSLDSIGDAIDDISERFSALGIIGITALQNITNKAVDAGLQLASSLTVDQVAAGFSKYEENTSNIVALMNQLPETESDMETVEKYMEKLSWYSDATSFDLVSMTSALKSFAAQGMSAEDSIPIIMGIGNSVTYAGVSAKEGSEAFGIWAKAIATGNLSLIQWRQLANRGVVTSQTKKDLMEAAVAAGTLTKVEEGLYETNEGLRVSMEEFETTLNAEKGKWVTKEVIERVFGGKYGTYTDVLSDYTMELEEQTGQVLSLDDAMKNFESDFGDLSDEMDKGKTYLLSATEAKTFTEAIDAVKDAMSTQWMNVFTSIFGNAEKAKELWTDVNTVLVDTFVPPVKNLALLLAEWNSLGGRDSLIEGFKNLGKAIGSIINPIKEAFRSIFPPASAQALVDATNKFRDFTAMLVISEESGEKLKSVFTVLFSIIKLIKGILEGLFKVAGGILGIVAKILGVVLNLIGSIAQLSVKMADTIKSTKLYSDVLAGIKNVGDSVKAVILAIASAFGGSSEASERASESGENFYNKFEKIRSKLEPAAESIRGVFEKIGDTFIRVFNWDTNLSAVDNIGLKFENLKKTLSPLSDKIKSWAEKIKMAITSLFEKGETSDEGVVGESTSALTKMNTVLTKIANGIVTAVNFIFDALSRLFGKNKETDPSDSISSMEKYSTKIEKIKEGFFNFVSNLGTIFDTANTGLLGLLLLKLSKFFDNLADTLGNGLEKTLKGLGSKFKGEGFARIGEGIKSMAQAVLMISAAVIVLSLIPEDKLTNGLSAMIVIEGMMILMSKIMQRVGGVKFNVQGTLLSMSLAILSMSMAVKMLSKLDAVSALGSTGVLMLLILSVSEALKNLDDVDTTQVSKLTIVGSTMLLFARAVKKLSGIPFPDILWGTGALIALLFSMAGAMKILSKSGDVDASANSLIKLSVALAAMSAVMKFMSSLSGQELESAVLGVAAALGSLVVGLLLVSMLDTNNVTKAATAMVIMSAAMLLLVPSMMAFKDLEPKQIGMGLLALAGAFAVIGIAGLLLRGVTIPIYLLSESLLMVSVAVTLASVGLALLGPALASAAAIIVASAPIILLAIKTIIAGIASLGGDIAVAVASLIGALCAAIVNSLDSIIAAIRSILNAIGICVLEFIPTAILIILTFIGMVIRALALTLDTIVDAIVKLLIMGAIAVADGLRNNAKAIAYAFLDVIEAVFEAILTALSILVPFGGSWLVNDFEENVFTPLRNELSKSKGELMGEEFVEGIGEGLDFSFVKDSLASAGSLALDDTELGQFNYGTGKDKGESFTGGLTDGISGSMLDFSSVTGLLGEAGIDSFSGVFGEESGFNLGELFGNGLAGGLLSSTDEVEEAGVELGSSAADGMQEETKFRHSKTYKEIGVKAGENFVEGVSEAEGLVKRKTSKMIYDAAHSDEVSDSVEEFESIGKNIVLGLVKGVDKNHERVTTAGASLGTRLADATKKVLYIESPSKLFMKIGKFVDEGLAIGLNKYSGVAAKAGANVAVTTANAAKDSLRVMTDVINSDIDAQPTIRPVLDLTNIQNGSATLNDLMSGRNMTASINSKITTDYDNTSSLIAEIARLRGDIQYMSDNGQLDPEVLGSAVRSALSDMGIYMDRDRVGKLVTNYQNNTRRATGAAI